MNKSLKRKKVLKITIIVILSVLVVLTAVSFIKIPFNKYWKSKDIFNSPITKIVLTGYPDGFGDMVEFDDEDLIQKWVDYLNSISIQHTVGQDLSTACAVCVPMDGNFFEDVIIYTEDSVISLTFYGGGKLQFGNSLRRFKVSGGEYPYKEVFETAKERHELIRE